MLRRWAKLVVFAATFATLWLVSMPARANGPLCDDRGATMVAPTPTALLPEQSLLALDDDCDRQTNELAFTRHRAPGERIVIADAGVACTTPAIVLFDSPASALLAIDSADAPLNGVRDRVDRPPRI
jgi:hypothetical protein